LTEALINRVRQSGGNARKRIFDRAVELADEKLEAAGLAPTPEGLTPHSLRHTYISLRVAIGDDPATIAQDAGHADMGASSGSTPT
jgi:integrase